MISVIIPVYNLSRYVGDALDSVRAQTRQDWEAIVVDDCSTDDSRAVVARYIEDHGDARIRLVFRDKNMGVSAARNLGAQHATGDWLAFLDGDDSYQPAFLDTLVPRGESRRAGVVYCDAEIWSPDHGKVGRYRPYWFDLLSFPRSLCLRNFVLPSGMLCTRVAWESVGGFDTDPHIQHAEDWDWVLRAVYAGVPFAHVREELVRWRRHDASAMTNRFMIYRRSLYLIRKHAHQSVFAPMQRRARITQLRNLAYFSARSRPEYSISVYRRAIRLQPGYLPAYVRLAAVWMSAHGLGGWLPRSLGGFR